MAATPTPLPGDDPLVTTDSSDSLLFVFDGPGDTTRRPARPNLPPPHWPGREPPHDPSPAPEQS